MKQEMIGRQWHQLNHKHSTHCPRENHVEEPHRSVFTAHWAQKAPDALPDVQPKVSKAKQLEEEVPKAKPNR